MTSTFFFDLPTYVIFIVIFSLIFFCNWLGYSYKKRQLEKYPGHVQESLGSIEASILGVMSLLLGFTFSVAVSKFESRRHSIIDEAKIIGTSILRTDMYPDSVRTGLRADFKEYVEKRIAYYYAGSDEKKIKQEIENAEEISLRMWKTVVLYSNDLNYRVRSQQMLPILNEMIDIITVREALRISKVPPLILWTLLILVSTAAFLLGSDYKGHRRNKVLLTGYALVMTLTLNLITELNHPRAGLINLHETHKKIEELRKLFP